MKRKKWNVLKSNKEFANEIASELDIAPLAALIVSSRGMDDFYDIGEFFDEDSPLSFEPLSILDMDKAAARINEAIDNFEPMCVYGDYDADGVTATALLYSYLASKDANVIRYIPDRIDEGYGLNCEAVKNLAGRGIKLIVTVDNGVSAIEEIALATSLGVDVVVTDHHKVGDKIPECVAVVDPHRPDCQSEFKEMSGVGVAFKLICALEGGNDDELLEEYGELVALGTIGDVVSLTGENRIMVRRGIKIMTENPRPGIAALIEAAGVGNKPFTASVATYTICPRINAAGRMSSADKALELLLCDDEENAKALATEINSLNASRQSRETEIYNSALALLAENPDMSKDKILVVDGEGWHQGVVGIVAAKLMEHFGKPAIVISRNGEDAKGSCRSIEGFSIYEALESVADCLTHFGGHTLAAGVGLESARISEFRKRINEYAANIEMPFAVQTVDCRLVPDKISLDIIDSVAELEPFGAGNPQPLFGLFNVTIEEISPVSDGKHIRMLISGKNSRTGVMFFGMSEKRFPFEKGTKVDLACHLERNVYNGEARVSIIVRGIRHSDTDEEKVLSAIKLYDRFTADEPITGQEAEKMLPDRQLQVDIFKSIKANPLKDKYIETLCVRLGDDGTRYAAIAACVDIMLEMGVLSVDDDNRISVPVSSGKVNLEDSSIMKKIRTAQNS